VAKGVFKTQHGFTVGLAFLGRHGEGRGSIGQQVHDGDTAIVEAAGNLGVRFLGVDAPEISFTLPETAVQAVDRRAGVQFVPIKDSRWEEFLADPFSSKWPGIRATAEAELSPPGGGLAGLASGGGYSGPLGRRHLGKRIQASSSSGS
jgi:hypothetical protein